MLEHEYDEFSKRYDGNYATPEYRHEDEELMRLIGRFASGSVLDVGCGTGLYLDNMDTPKGEYLGIDPSAGMLEKARLKHPDHMFRQQTLEELDPADGQFDTLIALYGVASYINPEKYSLIADLTRSGGTFFVMAYKKGYFPTFYTDEMKWRVRRNADHERLGQIEGARQFIFTNYLVTTNAPVESEAA